MFESIKRVAATLLAILQTRAELLAVEVEDEVLRFFSYLIVSLIALVCFGIAVLLAILLIIVIFWDTNRIAVVASLTGFFGISALAIALGVRNCYRKRPKFLAATLNEMSKDIEMLKPSNPDPKQ